MGSFAQTNVGVCLDVLLVYIGLKCGDCNADSAGRRQCLANGIATAGPRLLQVTLGFFLTGTITMALALRRPRSTIIPYTQGKD